MIRRHLESMEPEDLGPEEVKSKLEGRDGTHHRDTLASRRVTFLNNKARTLSGDASAVAVHMNDIFHLVHSSAEVCPP